MPELPEVETVRRQLLNHLKNRTIVSINIIHNNVFEKQDINRIKKDIQKQKITDIARKGKWLIFVLDDYYLLSHLRMEGKYLYRNINDEIKKHELVIFNIDNLFELRYQDTRKFGKMYLIKKEDLYKETPLNKLGLEPWDNSLDINYLKNKYKNKKLPIKSVLLDQSIITGIGNIYADEILFLSRIDPHKKCYLLNDKQLELIIENTRKVLEKAIKEGGTTIRSYTSEEGISGRFQNNLLVHKRENEKCLVCNTLIKRDKINGRSTYYCSKCQK